MGAYIISLLAGGWDMLFNFLIDRIVSALLPSFFLAGAIGIFVSKERIVKYLGHDSPKRISYPVAAIGGSILSVCSCGILPLFMSIYTRGAGLGPAIAFLFAGPCVNIISIVYTWQLLGLKMAAALTCASLVLSVAIGLAMSFIFRKEERKRQNLLDSEIKMELIKEGRDWKQDGLLLLALAFFTVIPTVSVPLPEKLVFIFITALIILKMLYDWYSREDISAWLGKTAMLARKILPIVFIGIFITGMIKIIIPPALMVDYFGQNDLLTNLIASSVGAALYFGTIVGITIVKGLVSLGMHEGPAFGFLITGQVISLPSMFLIARMMGIGKTVVYILLVLFLGTLSGFLYGLI